MATQHSAVGHAGKTVFVVEDDAAVADLIREVLDDGGYRVIAAGDGEQALQYLHQGKPDLVLSDVLLPRLDGLRLARAMAADRDLRAIPVVLMSAVWQPEPAGLAAPFIGKPFTIDGLLAVIEEHIGKADR